MTLLNLPFDPLLDMDAWVGQRSATFRFALSNAVTGEHLGDITPLRGAKLTHDTTRAIKRNLTMNLGKDDTAAINPLTDRVNPFMVFANGVEYPLGRYMFTASSRTVFTSGKLGNVSLNDEMFLVDQQITAGFNGYNFSVSSAIVNLLSPLPIAFEVQPAPFPCVSAWQAGTSRTQIVEALAVAGDYFSPWFDNRGVMQFIRTFNPASAICDFDFDAGNKVMRSGIVETDDILTAPNVFVVISNSSTTPDQPVVGIARVPPTAPNSVAQRGFEIPAVYDLQLADPVQAGLVAQGLAQRQQIFERTTLNTPPDPRHDSYNVIRWLGENWLELAWSMDLTEGGVMLHTLRKGYAA